VGQEHIAGGGHRGQLLGGGDLLGGTLVQTGQGHEPGHRQAYSVGAVGVVDALELGAHLVAVGQQLDYRRLVGD
jgi:hypothetical protein